MTLYYETGYASNIKFYAKSSSKHVMRAIKKRLVHVFFDINETFNLKVSDDVLMIKLKKVLQFANSSWLEAVLIS